MCACCLGSATLHDAKDVANDFLRALYDCFLTSGPTSSSVSPQIAIVRQRLSYYASYAMKERTLFEAVERGGLQSMASKCRATSQTCMRRRPRSGEAGAGFWSEPWLHRSWHRTVCAALRRQPRGQGYHKHVARKGRVRQCEKGRGWKDSSSLCMRGSYWLRRTGAGRDVRNGECCDHCEMIMSFPSAC